MNRPDIKWLAGSRVLTCPLWTCSAQGVCACRGQLCRSAAVSGLGGAGTKAKMPSVPGIVWLIVLLSRKSMIQSWSSLLLEVEEANA